MEFMNFNEEKCTLMKDYKKQQKKEVNELILISSLLGNKNIKKINLKDYNKLIYDQFNNIKIKYNNWSCYYAIKLIKKLTTNFLPVNNLITGNLIEETITIVLNIIELNFSSEEILEIIKKIFTKNVLYSYIVYLIFKKHYKKILKQIYIFLLKKICKKHKTKIFIKHKKSNNGGHTGN